MKYIVLIFIVVLISTPSFGQTVNSKKNSIDKEVQRIDRISNPTIKSFSIQALKKVLHYINYRYVTEKNKYVKISRQFSYKNDTIRQTFYLKNGEIIYATETIVSYHSENGKSDSSIWMGSFYFHKNRLIDHITLGHGKSELDTWKPEQDVLIAFKDAIKDLSRHKSKTHLLTIHRIKSPLPPFPHSSRQLYVYPLTFN